MGRRIDERNSFPVMDIPTTLADCRDATRRVDAFRSQSLGDYRINCMISEDSHAVVPNAMSSYFSGMGGQGKPGTGSPYPHLGKVK